MMALKRIDGFTLVELLVVLAILATLVGILWPLFFMPPKTVDGNCGNPPKAVQMVSVQHDGHWWILCRETFRHHPDCPCNDRMAEEE